jgi:SAM-dependent methyltransferase
MKLRESGMPEEKYWESLFNVPLILDGLQIDARLKDVVELGCGYGTFTIPVARRVSGTLTTFDIDETMVGRTRGRAAEGGVRNVVGAVRDVFAEGFGCAAGSQDACLVFNILHCEEPARVLAEAARILRPHGFVYVIHWRYDAGTPRGPSMDIRPRPEQCQTWLRQGGFELAVPLVDLPPYHYGLVGRKPK